MIRIMFLALLLSAAPLVGSTQALPTEVRIGLVDPYGTPVMTRNCSISIEGRVRNCALGAGGILIGPRADLGKAATLRVLGFRTLVLRALNAWQVVGLEVAELNEASPRRLVVACPSRYPSGSTVRMLGRYTQESYTSSVGSDNQAEFFGNFGGDYLFLIQTAQTIVFAGGARVDSSHGRVDLRNNEGVR